MIGPYLTKSRYLAGLQCSRRLWLIVNEPQPYEPPVPGSPLDVGQDIGRKAHLLFPGGVLVDEEPWRHSEAVSRTEALMADARVPAIFEAAFEFDGIRIRVDVLERLSDGAWGLREVKSSTGLKERYLDEIALQAYVLTSASVALGSIELIHINTAYVRGPCGVDWTQLFARLDLSATLAPRLLALPGRLPALRDCLGETELPHAAAGGQCGTPYPCEFWARCTADKPVDWIARLPKLSSARAAELTALGIDAISAIPFDFPLTPKQAIIRDAVVSGQPYVARDLNRKLEPFGSPACYLDFEAMMPPIPLYEGTRPYQTLPFQWSLHICEADGSLLHREFLADGSGDPRREFATTLIEALAGASLPIVVYSAYERTQLRDLSTLFPDLSDALGAIIARLADLLPVVRSAVYLREFEFSNSIKSVAPALCPTFSYDDLDGVADGMAASGAFLRLASSAVAEAGEAQELRRQLLAYCERDTLAMVETHRALKTLAASNQG